MSADKMREHVRLVEHWQDLCTRREVAARAHIRRTLTHRAGGDRIDEDTAVTQWLADDPMYQRLAAKRSGHQQAALMYGMAALVNAPAAVTR